MLWFRDLIFLDFFVILGCWFAMDICPTIGGAALRSHRPGHFLQRFDSVLIDGANLVDGVVGEAGGTGKFSVGPRCVAGFTSSRILEEVEIRTGALVPLSSLPQQRLQCQGQFGLLKHGEIAAPELVANDLVSYLGNTWVTFAKKYVWFYASLPISTFIP